MRRLPSRRVMQLSFLACVVCVALAVWLALSASWVVAGVLLVLGVWFGVDGVRALRWTRDDPGEPPRS